MKARAKSRITAIVLAAAMLLTMNINAIPVHAASTGSGTQEDPYVITTVADLQNINNDITAHYKLGANINLNNAEFTPIGNIDSGAFCGSFDGNGFTISNVYIDGGKYAGLFGCNEGQISNVTLSNITVKGTRYVGGVAGQNTSIGSISDCKVTSGSIQSEGGINDVMIAGICGNNEGSMSGTFVNGADIEASTTETHIYGGGITGYSKSDFNLTGSKNYGDLYIDSAASSYAGGIIGYGAGEVELDAAANNGDITLNSDKERGGSLHAGGLIGYDGKVNNSYNTGAIFAGEYNSADVDLKVYTGGLIAYNGEAANSFNEGNLGAEAYSWQGYYTQYAGGIIGYSGSATNCYNTGNATGKCTIRAQWGSQNIFAASGIIPTGKGTITNCYNTGNQPRLGNSDLTIINSYNAMSYSEKTKVSLNDLKNRSTFVNWDFDSTWSIDENKNSGMPVLRNTASELSLNIGAKHVLEGDTFTLSASKNGSAVSADWSSSDVKVATVGNNGKVQTGAAGTVTITAVDSTGAKAKCNLYVIRKAENINLADTTVPMGETISISLGGTMNNDRISSVTSTNPDIVKVDTDYDDWSFYGGWNILCTGVKAGSSTVTITTLSGVTASCTVTVENTAKSINISETNVSISRGDTKQLTLYTTPADTCSKMTWTTSDANVVKVDANGNITAVGIGSATITVKSDNGLKDTCSITVAAPVKSLAFQQTNRVMYKGDVMDLELVTNPSDTTNTINYSTSNPNVATVSTTGTVTAVDKGSTRITATASNGIFITCMINVIEVPVIVTGVTLDQTEHEMKTGEVFRLAATVAPEDATNPDITWASTDETVASVNDSGTVTAVGAGKTLITATSENGIVAYCTVNVEGTASTNLSRIYIPEIIASEDEYIDVPVMIENNPGIKFASLKVIYDNTQMQAESVTNGTVFDSVMGSVDNENAQVKLSFTSSEEITENGVLAMIRFKVPANAQEQNYSLKVCYFPGEIRDENEAEVQFNLGDGSLTAPACSHGNTEIINQTEASYEGAGYTGDEYCNKCGSIVKTGEIIEKKTIPTIKGLKVSSTSTSSIKLSWTGISGVSGYKVYRYKSGNYSLVKTVSGSSSKSYTVSKLSSGSGYKFKVRAYVNTPDGIKYGGYSSILSAPTKPSKGSIKKLSTGSKYVKVTWNKRTGTGYQVAIAKNSKFTKGVKTYKITSYKTLSKKITKLKRGTKYYVKVRAYKTYGGKTQYGSWSSYKTIKCK